MSASLHHHSNTILVMSDTVLTGLSHDGVMVMMSSRDHMVRLLAFSP